MPMPQTYNDDGDNDEHVLSMVHDALHHDVALVAVAHDALNDVVLEVSVACVPNKILIDIHHWNDLWSLFL